MPRPYKENVIIRQVPASTGKRGTRTHNKKARAAHRPQLFQKAEAVEAREILAQPRAVFARIALDFRARLFGRSSRLFQRPHEQSARGAGKRLRCLPPSNGGGIFRESG